jgi:hypothetical protein
MDNQTFPLLYNNMGQAFYVGAAALLPPPGPPLEGVAPEAVSAAPAVRDCPLSPACQAPIARCTPVSVFKHNGKVRRADGWTFDGRLRLAEVVVGVPR